MLDDALTLASRGVELAGDRLLFEESRFKEELRVQVSLQIVMVREREPLGTRATVPGT